MKSNTLIPGLLAFIAASNTEPPNIPPPPAYSPTAPFSLPEASDNMHASSSSECATLTTTLTLTLTKTIPVLPVTSSHTTSETGVSEPSSNSLVPPPPPPPSPHPDAPSSANSEESAAPTTIPTATTLIPVSETGGTSSTLTESSLSTDTASPTSKSSVMNSDESNTHTLHVPVQNASSRPIDGSATTLTKKTSFAETGTAMGTRTGTGSYVPSSTSMPPFADVADVIEAPGVIVGVIGWAVLML